MKNMTFKFRVYQFQNGLGETVFQVKERRWYGWGWINIGPLFETPRQWKDRDGMMQMLRERVEWKIKKRQDLDENKLRQKLKLIVIEDIEI